ncbi:MAG TPA: DUF4870 domain-containing protein [Pyrinomonadaceae bacterium]|nr:DUF4870 domain-containing protein [Pyrinomonadaceae bacterium]
MQNPPPNPTPPAGAPQTSSGMDPKIAAAVSYIWIVGVIFYFMEKENKFVRFHAMQSIIFGIVNTVIMTVLAIVAGFLTFAFGIGSAVVGGGLGSLIGLLVGLIWIIFWLLALVLLIGLIFAAVKAYQGQMFKLPIIGKFAEQIVNK